jgi:hypothetical protein
MIKSRFSYLKWTAGVAVLGMTIIAGVLLVHGHANPPDNKFSVQDAATREDNGKRVRAKPGYELVKDGNNVSARRLNKPTEGSSDKYSCQCSVTAGGGCILSTDPKDGGFLCGGSCGCKFLKVAK